MRSKAKNFYEILGLKTDVSSLEIKNAYRRLVKRLHPDIDYRKRTGSQRSSANKRMSQLNEAYETLKDVMKRAEYDSLIGANGKSYKIHASVVINPNDSDYACEQYLQKIFHPSRHHVGRMLSRYKQKLTDLSQDIYDDALIKNFEKYTDDVEDALRAASQLFSSQEAPKPLKGAELMMRYAIAQAADGLEEMRRFCQNYDYDHLGMAGSLFREYSDLSKKALHLTKS